MLPGGFNKGGICGANILLCRAVKEFPCIYDLTHVDYMHLDVQDSSWESIAKKCNDSVTSCKKRWHRIRKFFIQYLKGKRLPTRTNYYLANELNFLKPHTQHLKYVEHFSSDDDEEDLSFDIDNSLSGKTNNVLKQQRKRVASVKEDSNVAEKKTKKQASFSTEVEQVENELTPGRRSKRLSMRIAKQQHQTEDDDAAVAASSNKMPDKSSNSDEMNKEPTSEEITEVTSLEVTDENLTATVADKPKNLEPIVKLIKTKIPPQAVPKNTIEYIPVEPVVATINIDEATDNNNGDDDFWKLIKPQMTAMNARQKLHFKKKVFQSLIEVFDDGTNFPGPNELLTNVKPIPLIIDETTEEMRLIRELVCLVQAAKQTPELMNDNNASVKEKFASSKDSANTATIIAPIVDGKQPIVTKGMVNLAPGYRFGHSGNISTSVTNAINSAGYPRQIIRRLVKFDKQNPIHIDDSGRRIYRILPKQNINAKNALTPSTLSTAKKTNGHAAVGTFIVPQPVNTFKSSNASTLTSTTATSTINMTNQRLPMLPTSSNVSAGSLVMSGSKHNNPNLQITSRRFSLCGPGVLSSPNAGGVDAAISGSESLPKKILVSNAASVPATTVPAINTKTSQKLSTGVSNAAPAASVPAINTKTSQKLSTGVPISTHFATATLPIGGYNQFVGNGKSTRKSLPTNFTNKSASSSATTKLSKDPLATPALSNQTIAQIKKVVETKNKLPTVSKAAVSGIIGSDDFDTDKIKTEITDD